MNLLKFRNNLSFAYGHQIDALTLTVILAIGVPTTHLWLVGVCLGIVHEVIFQLLLGIPHKEKPLQALLDALDFSLGGVLAWSVIAHHPWYATAGILVVCLGYGLLLSWERWMDGD